MKMTFTVAGDMLVQRRIPKESTGFSEISRHLNKSEVRFVNLETTLHNGEYYANQYGGGNYLRADPKVLEDIKEYGFNTLSFANNHSMDFDRGGLMATKKYVDDSGIVNAGVGANLDEAASEAFKFLGVPNNLYWYYRKGDHFHHVNDVKMLVAVIKNVTESTPLPDGFFKTPFKKPELIYDWRAPK